MVRLRYDKSEGQLAVLLSHLVCQGTLALSSSGGYKLKAVEVPRPRKRSPSPRPASVVTMPPLSQAGQEDMSQYDTHIVGLLGLHGSLTLDRMHHLLTLSTVTPR